MNDPKKIVILHSDPLKRSRLKQLVFRSGHTPYCFENITICLDNLKTLAPDLVLIGPYSLDKISRFVYFLKTMHPGTLLLITGASVAVREFIASNRFKDVMLETSDYKKPAVERKIGVLTQSEQAGAQRDSVILIGNSPEMIKLRKLCSEISRVAENILIQGETGAGKDLVARTIHRWSNQKDSPLVKVNIAALSAKQELIKEVSDTESGNIDGGWDSLDKIFTEKQGGIVFLDGIEHMPPALQSKMESYLKQMKAANLEVDARKDNRLNIIAATSMDIETLVKRNQFSKGLFHGLSVFKIEIPPLRNHPEDIPLMADHISDIYCRKLSNGICDIPGNIMQLLQAYGWPGNYLELDMIVKKWFDSGFDEKIFECLGENIAYQIDSHVQLEPEKIGITENQNSLKPISMKGVCKQVVVKTEKKMIKEALQLNKWNRKKAARMLDISYRSILNKIKEYRLS